MNENYLPEQFFKPYTALIIETTSKFMIPSQ